MLAMLTGSGSGVGVGTSKRGRIAYATGELTADWMRRSKDRSVIQSLAGMCGTAGGSVALGLGRSVGAKNKEVSWAFPSFSPPVCAPANSCGSLVMEAHLTSHTFERPAMSVVTATRYVEPQAMHV